MKLNNSVRRSKILKLNFLQKIFSHHGKISFSILVYFLLFFFINVSRPNEKEIKFFRKKKSSACCVYFKKLSKNWNFQGENKTIFLFLKMMIIFTFSRSSMKANKTKENLECVCAFWKISMTDNIFVIFSSVCV